MILFLNFAPIEFMGGAEKWIYETAKFINRREKTVVMSVSPKISNLYARFVLKRSFESRMKKRGGLEIISLEGRHFMPWTSEYKKVKKTFWQARRIYLRYELQEVLLTLYYGSFSILKKTVAGIHSALIYKQPVSILDHLHNILYGSLLSKYVLGKFRTVHVLHKNAMKFVKDNFHLQNVISIPTSTRISRILKRKSVKKNQLDILFVGDLSVRKGVDVLLEVIEHSPAHFIYHIAGNGEFADKLKSLSQRNLRCKYYGYLNGTRLNNLYLRSNVLFLPSRAEGFPLVFHEAMLRGLPVVTSDYVCVGLPKFIEYTTVNNTVDGYLNIFEKLHEYLSRPQKFLERLTKRIKDYYAKNFDYGQIQLRIESQLFA